MRKITFTNNKIHKLRGIFIWIVLVFILLLLGYIFMPDEPELTYPTKQELAWMDKPTGSAEYLNGKTVLVSIYMDEDKNSSKGWSDKNIKRTQEYMDIAVDYLEDEAKSFGCEAELIYDTSENQDLMYFSDMNVIKEGMDDDAVHDTTDSWTEENVDYLALLEKYDADSIGFMFFMNASGTSWCYPYYPYPDEPEYGYLEKAYIYLYDEYDDYETPATYAHEILHMFGAVDLYTRSKEDGMTKKVIKYVEDTYPRDIMYTVYDENNENVYDHVPCEIGPITAYFLGFTNHCGELDMFPQMKRLYKASYPEY